MVKDYDEKELLAIIPEDMVYENQTIKNDFIFGKVMQDKGLYRNKKVYKRIH